MGKMHLIHRNYLIQFLWELLNMLESFYVRFDDEFIDNHIKDLKVYISNEYIAEPENCDYVESYVVDVFKEVE